MEKDLVEKGFRENEEGYRLLFENMLNGFAYCKMVFEEDVPKDFIYLNVNSTFATLTGLNNVVGKKVSEVIPGIRESDPELFDAYGRVARTGVPERFETFVESLGQWFSISVYSPQKEHFVAVFDVVTERKRMEENAAHLAAIVESSDDAIIGKTMDGDITSWNHAAEIMYGYTAEEVIGKSISILAPLDVNNEFPSILQKIRRSETIKHFETRRRRKDGKIIDVSLSVSPIKDASGKIIGVSTIARDITARKQTEDELRKSRDELEMRVEERTAELEKANRELSIEVEERKRVEDLVRTEQKRLFDVLETLPAMVCLLTSDYRVAFANRSFRERFGESHGRHCYEYCFGRPEPCDFCESYKVLKTGQPHHWEVTGPDGSIIDAHDFPFTDADGSPMILEMDIDITDWRRAEAELKSTMAKLEQSNQTLQDFASVASHDLQEPLRKIISFGNMLKQKYNDSLGQTGNDYLSRMLDATLRMQSLLNGLLEYSRVTMQANPFMEVDLRKIVGEVLSDLEVRVKRAGAKVRVLELPVVKADPTQMRQVFQNLIGNALKFIKENEKPVIEVRSAVADGKLRIEVEDNGIGFGEQHIDRIFAPFQRLHGRNSQYEGTGMGLAICKRIVERHGGSITAKSMPGEGSIFIISLPCKQFE